jgi:hypothetical protein
MVKFPNLEAEMVRRDVSNKKIAETIGVCERTLRNKMIGRVSFTWPEVKKIRGTFFADMTLDELFTTSDERDTA